MAPLIKFAAKAATTSPIASCTSATPRAAAPSDGGPSYAPPGPAASSNGRAHIEGIDCYYEVHGTGEPLLVLHGGLGSIDTFGPGRLMPLLTQGRQVIAVDLQGHGRTTLGTRPIRCESIADDLDKLLGQLGYTQVDVLGYSFGGSVALRLAMNAEPVKAQQRRLP